MLSNYSTFFRSFHYVLLYNEKYMYNWQVFIRERRRETRRETSLQSTQRASCHSHMGEQNNIITREILILAMWCIEQTVILFRCRTDIRDEPARPGHDAL